MKIHNVSELESYRKSIRESNKRFSKTVTLCGGTGCRAEESEKTQKYFRG